MKRTGKGLDAIWIKSFNEVQKKVQIKRQELQISDDINMKLHSSNTDSNDQCLLNLIMNTMRP
jgi:hypothetical protein